MSEKEKKMQEEFIQNRDEEEAQLTIEFAIELLRQDAQIKELNDVKKEIKADAKSNGIPVKQVMAALTALKKKAKSDLHDQQVEDFLTETLSENVDVNALIGEIVQK
jgi:uncharacterized protein (UPF0335 family)